MATATSEKTINGSIHPNYTNAEAYQPGQATDAQTNPQSADPNHAEHTTRPSGTEIGWYFVEQYYTTLSKEPSRLHLYYTKKSQFVAGDEAEKVDVAVGQRKISDKIKEMDIQDCKVRVSNVDAQDSGKEILVQVIGEMSNRAAPHRKFVQTFVLAQQPTGYFVLNDIFRYIIEEEDDEMTEAVEGGQAPPPEKDPMPATMTDSNDPAAQEHDAERVDQKLEEEVLAKPDEPVPAAMETPDDASPADTPIVQHADDAPVAVVKEDKAPEHVSEATAVEEIKEPEKPRDPDPTPVASPPKPAKATPAEPPAAPPKPAAPKTWANLVASKNSTATPTVSPSKAATPATPAPPRSKTSNGPSSAKENATPGGDQANKPQVNGSSGWQMAGTDKQRQGRQHSQSVSSNQGNVLAYVKNVTDKVDASILRVTLAGFGELVYFDVSRPKNCAFVEFADPAAYAACVDANPHNIGGEQVFVEERRPRGNAYGGGFNGRGGLRGGRPGPNDRPGNQGGRGGSNKDGGRGNYAPRGARGRGQTAQAA